MHSGQIPAHKKSDILDKHGNTALHVAAKNDDANTFANILVRMLTTKDAEFKKNDQRKTAFDLIPDSRLITFEETFCQLVIEEYQSANTTKLETMRKLGRKLLQYALANGNVDLACQLIKYQSPAVNDMETQFYIKQLYTILKNEIKIEDKKKYEIISLDLIQLISSSDYIYSKYIRLSYMGPKRAKSLFDGFKETTRSPIKTMDRFIIRFTEKYDEQRKYIRRPILNIAIKNGYYDVVDKLLEKNIDVDSTDERDNTALHTVARIDNPALFFKILNRSNINFRNIFGLTAHDIIQSHDKISAYKKYYYGLLIDLTIEIQEILAIRRYDQLPNYLQHYDDNYNDNAWFEETLTNLDKIEKLEKEKENILANLTQDQDDKTALNLTGVLLNSPKMRSLLSSWQHSFLYLNLRSLNLSNTNISYEEAKQLGRFLTFYQSLEVLTLSNNKLGGVHVKESWFSKKESAIQLLSQVLYGYRAFQRLDLDTVGLEDQDTEPLQNMLSSFDTFVYLSFADNPRLTEKYREKLEESLQHAIGRAELLGQSMSFGAAGKWKSIMSNLPNHFSPHRESEEEKGKEKEIDPDAVSWEQLYKLSQEIINEFLPNKERLDFLKKKNDNR